MSKKIIAIDGPGGSGKSTVARILAEKLNYKYLDTGAMYRAITWLALQRNININDKNKLTKLAANIKISFSNKKIFVNNKDITDLIRKNKIDQNVSYVARIKGVREEMVKLQRKIAQKGGIIVDGRDIGSRVLPDADFKFYLTASLKERAVRRYRDIEDEDVTLDNVKSLLKKRDMIDKNREESPLIKAEDAIFIDTTDLSIREVINKLIKIITGE